MSTMTQTQDGLYPNLKKQDPEVYEMIKKETFRQHENIELIASENFVSEAVLEAQGSALTNKYAEGYPGKRWYGGCENVDVTEQLAIDRAKKLFGADHANVQPHSGTTANVAVFMTCLELGDKILAMDLAHGGHLSHGHPMNFSGKYFDIIPYGVNKETELLDYDEIERLAVEHKPKLLIMGASAYSRIIDFKRSREIADKVGAKLLVDMAHFAGLVATGEHPSPVPFADFVTTTTHKTLRGPRGGLILCREEYAKKLDSVIFPGVQGGPLQHVIAAKAVALKEALSDEFKVYQKQIVLNSRALAKKMQDSGFRIVSGGTDNHLMLLDVTAKDFTGKEASNLLDEVRITVNKNCIPFDTNSPFVASGIRLGTPAVTGRGMKEAEMEEIGDVINLALNKNITDDDKQKIRDRVGVLVEKFPLYGALRSKF